MSSKKSKAIHATPQLSPTKKNRLFYGDNLDILRRKIAAESVDLCYIDPPFNSKRNYFQIYNNIGGEDRAQSQAFMDTWEWGDEAIAGYAYIVDVENLNNGKLTPQTVALIKGLTEVLGEGDLLAYLVHMTLRIVEIHRVLKPTGCFYLHCDPTASHFLKLVCDGIFCGSGGDFVNEIVWHYRTFQGQTRRYFPKKHDTIFLYSKSHTFVFNEIYDTDFEETIDSKRWAKYFNEKNEIVAGYMPDHDTRFVRYLNKWKRINDRDPVPDDVIYEAKGQLVDTVWNMKGLDPKSKERLGYPTQKPEALLERVIQVSSNEGDIVLDAYCGCGTTVAVAQRLKRRWIGIDITYQSISLILKRLEDKYHKKWPVIEANIQLDGVPRDIASAVALANRKDDKTRKEFEKWALLTYSKNQARINDKKGADAGIDGEAYFMLDAKTNGTVVFQVKSGGAQRDTIATLNSDRQREKAEIGILITMDNPTPAMKREVIAAGKYKHPLLNREDNRIQIVTIAEILEGKRIDLPMGRAVVKSAEAFGDSGKQARLI
jgi:DNA modification methylase